MLNKLRINQEYKKERRKIQNDWTIFVKMILDTFKIIANKSVGGMQSVAKLTDTQKDD